MKADREMRSCLVGIAFRERFAWLRARATGSLHSLRDSAIASGFSGPDAQGQAARRFVLRDEHPRCANAIVRTVPGRSGVTFARRPVMVLPFIHSIGVG